MGFARHRTDHRSLLISALLTLAVILTAWAIASLVRPGQFPAEAMASELPTATAALTGPATVSDGDGLRLNGERIRLQGIDAFELHQTCGTGPCGQQARDALQHLVAGRHVACEPVDADRYGRTVAYCHVDGVDLGEQMVLQGHALAFRRYSREYVDEEEVARRNRAGAWASDFQNPADWRRDHPRG